MVLGRLFLTHSGARGTQGAGADLSRAAGRRARCRSRSTSPIRHLWRLGPTARMYVSSRFEGQVYRLIADDQVEVYASELGVPTGLAFARDGSLFVGDRSGSIFRVRAESARSRSLRRCRRASRRFTWRLVRTMPVRRPRRRWRRTIRSTASRRTVSSTRGSTVSAGRRALPSTATGRLYVADALAGRRRALSARSEQA